MIYWTVLLMDPDPRECVDPTLPQVCYPDHASEDSARLNLVYATWEQADTERARLAMQFKNHKYIVASVLPHPERS